MNRNIFLTLFLVLTLFVFHAKAQMKVHMINVGQGSATLIEFPCAAVLIDAGGESNYLFNSSDALKNYLEDFFDRRSDLNYTLQCVYLTHPHKDHTYGVPIILEPPYIIKNAVTDGLEVGSGKSGQIKLHRAAQNSEENNDSTDNIGFEAVYTAEIKKNGFTNEVIDPVNCTSTNPLITILWGTSTLKSGWSTKEFNNANNHSLVIKIEYGQSSVLIIGDLEDVAQKTLVSKYSGTSMLDADVYVVGHHGSKNGSSMSLLDRVTPEIALIGVGDANRQIPWTAWAYGHPNKGILDRLQQRIATKRTPIEVRAGTGAKTFVNYTVSKAIYATGWDDHIILEGDAKGNWKKLGTMIVPALVNINTATLEELEKLPGIGTIKAKAIIEYRSQHGNFVSMDELDNVPGIGPATINLLKPFIEIQ